MKPIVKIIGTALILLLLGAVSIHYFNSSVPRLIPIRKNIMPVRLTPAPTPKPVSFRKPGPLYEIPRKLQVYESFNNCGPATLSMLLSYYGINVTQKELGKKLRPYQNPQGNNDDKSVFLPELASAAETYGMVTFYRPDGTIELLKTLIANDIPVIVETWLHPNEDIGHYRLVRGFDDTRQEIIQDDSYQGPNLKFPYGQFLGMWQPFNYEYLVIVPKDKAQLVMAILGTDADIGSAWKNANSRAAAEISDNPNDIFAQFNLSVSGFYLGEYQKAVDSYQSVKPKLPSRMLWYQPEPIEAYLKLKNYDKVFSLTENILTHNNVAYSELYLLRGQADQALGKTAEAKQEFEKAYTYNVNSPAAKLAFESVESK